MKKMLIKGEKKFRFATKEAYERWKNTLKGNFNLYVYEFKSEQNFNVCGKTKINIEHYIEVTVSGIALCDKVV